MAKVTIPNAFANAVTSIPLSDLDADFTAVAASINDANTYSNYAADSGVADAYAVTLSGVTTTYTAGLRIQFKAANTNTGPSSLDVNGQGTKQIVLSDGAHLPASAILANSIVDVIYDGTAFQLLNDASGGSETITNLTVTGTANINALSTGNATITGGTLSNVGVTANSFSSNNVSITGGALSGVTVTATSLDTAAANITGGTVSGVNLSSANVAITGGTLSNVTISSIVGGLPVSSGGTGNSTLTANALLTGNGTSPIGSIPPGAVGNVLVSNGTNWYASTVAGTGDVSGPGSSTDNALARWSGTAGIGLKNSLTSLDDSGNLQVTSIGFNGGTSYTITFTASGTLGSNQTYTFPDTYGAAGQTLTSNGSGGLSWATGGISTAKVYFMGQF